jgi:hypothetical protein
VITTLLCVITVVGVGVVRFDFPAQKC